MDAWSTSMLLLFFYAHSGEVAAKRGSWSLCIKIVMEITLLTMENHGIVFLNNGGNPEKVLLYKSGSVIWLLSRGRPPDKNV